jgi:hypothetical protein
MMRDKTTAASVAVAIAASVALLAGSVTGSRTATVRPMPPTGRTDQSCWRDDVPGHHSNDTNGCPRWRSAS